MFPCFPLNFPYPGVLFHLCNSSSSLLQIRKRLRTELSLLQTPQSRSCSRAVHKVKGFLSLGSEQNFCTPTNQRCTAEHQGLPCNSLQLPPFCTPITTASKDLDLGFQCYHRAAVDKQHWLWRG